MHCHAHILNLVLVESCSNNTIACNFFGDVQSLYVFIEGSTKRHSIFVDMQKTELCSTKQPVTLKRLSDTRWACRVNSIIAVKSTLPAIVSTLEKIVDSDHDSRSMSEANGLLRKVCSFQFILSFTVLLDLLSYTKSLSDYLQRQDIDFVSAVQMHESLLSILTQKRRIHLMSTIVKHKK